MKRKASVLTGLMILNLFINNVSAKESTKTDNKTSTEIPEVVVTASKIKENPLDVSSFVEVIPEEEIKKSPAKNLGDIFSELGLGHTHKYPGALISRISIRGISSDLFDPLKGGVLILIDGQRASTANLAKIPLENVKRIEIVKGPFSVLYGTQAMGGVINIITKKVKKEGMHFKIKGEIGSWSYWKGTGKVTIKKSLKNSSINSIDFYILEDKDYQTIKLNITVKLTIHLIKKIL